MRYVGIDPSTRTGLVILDEDGQVVVQKEITGVGKVDPKRMGTLVQDLVKHIKAGDKIAIEGFSYGSQGNAMSLQYGVGFAIRIALWARKYEYIEASPGQLKKFGTGKGNTPKKQMTKPIREHWGFSSSSDNIVDAFVLAQIAKSYHNRSQEVAELPKHQQEVIEAIVNPPSRQKATAGA
ncbi:hypothetical protein ACE106_07240 [Shouchella clausii]|uniref:hypothetical protein n=1 Tax=Shouchella clausii TaxID=79880 RepID=UPI00289D77A9|nr:hypothetical protein [Shouchella clausii]